MENLKDKIINSRYRIEEKIGVGGMAVVYRAIDLNTNTRVAVKVLKDEFLSNPTSRKRFESESKIIEMLSHENIVRIYNVGFNDDLYYIVMEYVDGISLKQYIDQEGKLEVTQAVYFMSQVMKALAHAHSKGVVHRDIKPQNIMILRDGSVKVMDFGIAKNEKSVTITMADKAIGSVHYISPEQVEAKKCDARSDIYSAGISFYEMLTGCVPFDADELVSVAVKQIKELPRAPKSICSTIPNALNEIILKSIAKKPENRYQNADEVLRDLMAFKNDNTITFGYNIKFLEETKAVNNDERPTAVLDNIPKHTSNVPVRVGIFEDLTPKKIAILSGVGVAALSLLALIIIGIVSIFGGSLSGNTRVPNLVGKLIYDVVNSEDYSDINIKIAEEKYSDEYEKGVIYAQSPEDGMSVKKGKTVEVWVSLGKELIEIPNIGETSSSSAQIRLASLGFVCVFEQEYSSKLASGLVIRTEPAIGTKAERGSRITVYVSKGANLAEGTSTPPVSASQTLIIPAPDMEENFLLDIYQDGKIIYSKNHSKEERNIAVDIYGKGETFVEVFVNDKLYLSYPLVLE